MKLHMDYTRIETQLMKKGWITHHHDHLFFFCLSIINTYKSLFRRYFSFFFLFILPFCSFCSRLFLPLESVSTTNIFLRGKERLKRNCCSYIRFFRSLNHTFIRISDWITVATQSDSSNIRFIRYIFSLTVSPIYYFSFFSSFQANRAISSNRLFF